MDAKRKDDGGPAFPNPYIEADPLERGMTLRDWFAGQALSGDLAANDTHRPTYEGMALRAYTLADAMIAERRK